MSSKFAKRGAVLDVDSGKFLDENKVKDRRALKEIQGGKAEKEPKAAKKAVKAKAEPKEKEADNRKIKLLTKENPKREGTASYDRFELYRSSKTVADFIDAGGTMGDVRYDQKAGHISVA